MMKRKANKLFPEDLSSDPEPNDGDSTLSYAQKVTTEKPKINKILAPSVRKCSENQIAKHSDLKREFHFKKIKHSLELPLKVTDDVCIISSDEDLEKFMSEMFMPTIEQTDSE